MQKFLISIIGTLSICSAFAVGENIPTSKSYVDAALATKQDTIPANDGVTQVLTNTGTAGEYGTKGIYDANGAYATQTQNLVDAATMNAGVQNAIDSEFQCIEWLDPNDHSSDCLLMDVFGPSPQQIIPREYTQIEYIESTGTQCINANVSINKNSSVETNMNFQFIARGTNNPWMGTNGYVQLSFNNGVYSLGGGATGPVVGGRDSIKITYQDKIETLYVNGKNIANRDWSSWGNATNNSSFSMFALWYNTNSPSTNIFSGRIFQLDLSINGVLVRNFIPARRNSDGVLGMYDTVSNTFFTNAGTGEFIAGPVVYIPQSN